MRLKFIEKLKESKPPISADWYINVTKHEIIKDLQTKMQENYGYSYETTGIIITGFFSCIRSRIRNGDYEEFAKALYEACNINGYKYNQKTEELKDDESQSQC